MLFYWQLWQFCIALPFSNCSVPQGLLRFGNQAAVKGYRYDNAILHWCLAITLYYGLTNNQLSVLLQIHARAPQEGPQGKSLVPHCDASLLQYGTSVFSTQASLEWFVIERYLQVVIYGLFICCLHCMRASLECNIGRACMSPYITTQHCSILAPSLSLLIRSLKDAFSCCL